MNYLMKGTLCHVKWPCGIVNVIQACPITKIYDVSIKAIVLGRQCKKTEFVSPLSSCASAFLILTLRSVSPGRGGKTAFIGRILYKTELKTLDNEDKT